MHLPHRSPAILASVCAASLVAGSVALNACRAVPAQTVARGSAGSTSAAQAKGARSTDSVDQALDRIDAARTRLAAADAEVARALTDLDAALDDAARLGGSRDEPDLTASAAQLEQESHAMSQRWQNEGRRWRAFGGHWADFGQRIAMRAQRLAQREAFTAQREAEREIDRDLDTNTDDWEDRGRPHHHRCDSDGDE